MLQYHGFVEQDPANRGYVPGRALVDVGIAVVGDVDIRAYARPFLEQLRDEMGETVQLVVLQGSQALFVDGVESTKALRAGVITGRTMPAHVAASGKTLLAALPEDRLHERYPTARIPAVNGQPARPRTDLERELAVIREQGYAMTRGVRPEDDDISELCAIAAAVRGAAGIARASIVVTAPLTRASDEWIERAAEATVRTADALSAALS
jgi:DNA-binding IclR family transcriptional regulator